MKAGTDLFELIKSLDGNEKRYFRLFASMQSGRKNYLRMFDAISRQTQYDEAAIKRQFAGEKFIKQLTFTKNYLFKLILKSLRSYHGNKTTKQQLRNMLTDLEILFDRGLYRACEKLLRRARARAGKYELFLELEELAFWETRLQQVSFTPEKFSDHLHKLKRDMQHNLSRYRNKREYDLMGYKLFLLSRREQMVRREEGLMAYDELMQTPLMADAGRALSYHALFSYYEIQVVNSYIRKQYNELYRYGKLQKELAEAHPHFIKEAPIRYIAVLNSFSLACLYLGRFAEFSPALQQLRDIRPTSLFIEREIFLTSYNLETDYLLRKGDYSAAEAIEREIEGGLRRAGEMRESGLLSLYSNLAHLFFISGEHRKALKWINSVLNSRALSVREDIHCYARIFNLLVHFELDNMMMLEYTVKSTYRFLSKRQNLFRFEQSVLRFIRQSAMLNTRAEWSAAFESLRDEWLQLRDDEGEREAFDYFDFIAWVESKIQNRPLADVMNAKAG